MQKLWTMRSAAILLGVMLTASAGVRCTAQSTSLDEAIAAELQLLANHAGTIFVGQITAIQHQDSVVNISFRVDEVIAGTPGSVCTLREWAGMWPPGHSRYIVGQRVLAFMHTPSVAGFGSPVHGAEGLVPVVVQGANAPVLLDIRRLAASVVRSPDTPLPTDAEAGVQLNDVLGLIAPGENANARLFKHVLLPSRGIPPVDLPRIAAPRERSEPVRITSHGPLMAPVLTGAAGVQ